MVLGAGISKPFNLPTWRDLLINLYAKEKKTPPKKDPKRQAEDYRNSFYKDNLAGFLETVKVTLYKDVNASYEVLRRCDALAAVASLAMSSRRGSASEIITFNWDDLLETYLGYHGFVTSSVTSDSDWSTSADISILHPHGFLPLSAKRKPSSDIVFDQWSYSTIMGKEGSLWRQSLEVAMRGHTCLFIGLSGNDDNLDLLLKECESTHASRQEKTAFWAVTYTTSKEDADLEFWRRRRVFPVVVKNFTTDLPKKLFGIAQAAASLD